MGHVNKHSKNQYSDIFSSVRILFIIYLFVIYGQTVYAGDTFFYKSDYIYLNNIS